MNTELGYEGTRFTVPVSTEFTCGVCNLVVRNPLECIGCGILYCSQCIIAYQLKSSTCTNRCPIQTSQFQSIKGALMRFYKNLEIKCSDPKCQKIMKIPDMQEHESKCLQILCLNNPICNQTAANQDPLRSKQACTTECLLTNNLWEIINDKKTLIDEKTMKDLIEEFIKGNQQNDKMSQPLFQSKLAQAPVGKLSKQLFKWDKTKAGTGISITEENTRVFLMESAYMFRTVIADNPMMQGIHYWEIHADQKTENELKIGVSNSNQLNFNAAFCDSPNGWAYYGLAQIRHNSNASGGSYGKRFKKEGFLGCYLNMNTGVLAFSLDGEMMGIAFQNPLLQKGPIYPAVALLHCAGCTLVSGKPIPSIFENV